MPDKHPLCFPPRRVHLPDPRQFATLAQMGFNLQDVARMNIVDLYDRAVEVLRLYKPETVRLYADALFGAGAWRQFDFLREETHD